MIHREIPLVDGPCAGHNMVVNPHENPMSIACYELADESPNRIVIEHTYLTHVDEEGRLVGIYNRTFRRPLPLIHRTP